MSRRSISLQTSPEWRLTQAAGSVAVAVSQPDPRLVALARIAAERLTEPEMAATALRLVQTHVRYVSDPVSAAGEPTEQFQSVSETLDDGGDCEDLSALLCALFTLIGLRARLVWIDYEHLGAEQNHVSVKVQVNGTWMWAEPSVAGAVLGEEPRHAAIRTGDRRAV